MYPCPAIGWQCGVPICTMPWLPMHLVKEVNVGTVSLILANEYFIRRVHVGTFIIEIPQLVDWRLFHLNMTVDKR